MTKMNFTFSDNLFLPYAITIRSFENVMLNQHFSVVLLDTHQINKFNFH